MLNRSNTLHAANLPGSSKEALAAAKRSETVVSVGSRDRVFEEAIFCHLDEKSGRLAFGLFGPTADELKARGVTGLDLSDETRFVFHGDFPQNLERLTELVRRFPDT